MQLSTGSISVQTGGTPNTVWISGIGILPLLWKRFMGKMPMLHFALRWIGLIVVLFSASLQAEPSTPGQGERVTKSDSGEIRFEYLPMDKKFRNPWPANWEAAFWKRGNELLQASPIAYGGTYFENEKLSYPNAFIAFSKGDREKAIKFLQAEDPDAHAKKETMGVDWFPSFTIRNQVRKYFFFGQYLDGAYRKKMYDSAKIWTEKDPLSRPNSFYQQGKEGWNVDSKNSWVDVRNTDNLRAMRECAVYLMAEETGNREVAEIYKKRIQAYVGALYQTGMGEWDSANYMAHGFTAYLQLYDFARDPEVKLLGKAALDWLCAAAAVKYYKGNWAGANKRDYNNIPAFVGASGEFWVYFGDTPGHTGKPYRDFIHLLTSPYRPPEAVVNLARKKFSKPMEILASKPSYKGWYQKPGGEDAPEFFETVSVGNTWQLGTLPTGHVDDVNGFRLATDNSRLGSDIWVLATDLKGYKGITTGAVAGEKNGVAQHRNQVIWMNPRPDTTYYFLVPKPLEIREQKGVTFFKTEKTWVAIHHVNTGSQGIDEEATRSVTTAKDGVVLPDNQVWVARGTGHGPTALVMEIGEQDTHGSFEDFQSAVLAKSKIDHSKLAESEIHFTGCKGEQGGIRLNAEGLPTVFRAGQAQDFKDRWALYAGKDSPITLGWKEGILKVNAGGASFTGTLKDGRYTFENK